MHNEFFDHGGKVMYPHQAHFWCCRRRFYVASNWQCDILWQQWWKLERRGLGLSWNFGV